MDNDWHPFAFPRGEGGRASARSDEECGRQSTDEQHPSDLFQGRSCRHSSPVAYGDTLSPGEGFLHQLHRLIEESNLPITLSQEESDTHITLTLTIPK